MGDRNKMLSYMHGTSHPAGAVAEEGGRCMNGVKYNERHVWSDKDNKYIVEKFPYCAACGKIIEDIAHSFCGWCGEPLTQQKSLSLKKLREMDGEPVWIESTKEWLRLYDDCNAFKVWKIMSISNGYINFSRMGLPTAIDNENFNKYLKFYAHKPRIGDKK